MGRSEIISSTIPENAMPDISSDKVCFLIVKARQFESAMADTDADTEPADMPIADGDDDMAADYAEDPVYQEVVAFMDGLNEDEQIELVALMWVGRGDYTADEWSSAVDEARRARDEHGHTASYLLGTPLVADYLEEGLSQFGQTCDEVALNHL